MTGADHDTASTTDAPGWRRAFWSLLGRRLFAITPHTAHRTRRAILRLAGAQLTGMVKIRRSVRIDRPWHLRAHHLSIFGDHAALRLSRPLTVGERAVVSQMAIVSTEMLEPATGRRVCAPVTIEDDAWLATEAVMLPGSTLGAGSVVGARCLVHPFTRTPDWMVCVGQPVRPLKGRAFKDATATAPAIAPGGSPA